MKRYLGIMAALSGLFFLPACEGLTTGQRTAVGITGGAAEGLITAEALNANDNWRLIAALAGAAAGTLVAQNCAGKQCANARGDGTYHTAACP